MIQKISHQLADKIVLILGNNTFSPDSDVDVYAYAVEIVIETTIKIIVFAAAGIYFDMFWPLIFVLVAFVGYRVVVGGAHMSNFLACLVISLLLICGISIIAIYSHWQMFYWPVFWGTLVFAFVSVIDLNSIQSSMTVEQIIRKFSSNKVIIYLIAWIIAVYLMWILGLAVYGRCLILGALGGIFFSSPYGSRLITILDRWE